MKSKNVKVGPLSAVSLETLESVKRVLLEAMSGGRSDPSLRLEDWADEEDERVALEFALAVRLATNPMEGGE
tara:strand:- start:1022 stop:1237 length:216 start_codon:yes stop_codon:yes gene_type:complete